MSINQGIPQKKAQQSLQRRRTAIFIVIFTGMLFTLLAGILFLSGVVKAPYEPAFKHGPIKPSYYTQPCLPANTTPIPLDQLKVSVYNTTEQAGLAGNIAKNLKDRGAQIIKVANSQTQIAGTADIRTSIHSLREAYTLAEMIPESTVTLIRTNPAAPRAIALLLGDAFDQITDNDAYSQLDPNRHLAAPSDCIAVDPVFAANELQSIAKSRQASQTPSGTPEKDQNPPEDGDPNAPDDAAPKTSK